MTVEQLRKAHETRPFRPFTLKLADGSRFHVRHPECLSYSPTGRTVVAVDPEDETFEIIDLLLVASIRVGNGHRPRKRR